MKPETFFAIARPSGSHGGEETTEERFVGFNKDGDIATNFAENLSKCSKDRYEVYRVELTVLERVA